MKKLFQLITVTTTLLCATGAATASSGAAFQKGNFYLGGAVGLGSGLGYFGGAALIANAEYAVTENIGLGGAIGYWSYTDSVNAAGYTTKYKYSIIPVIFSGAYHFHVGSPKLDLGAGVSIGYYVVSSSVETSVAGVNYASASASGIAVGIFGLVRYHVSDVVALRGKVGYGITALEVGVDFRF